MNQNWKINPEWQALDDKPHLIPAICHPDIDFSKLKPTNQKTMNTTETQQPDWRSMNALEAKTQDGSEFPPLQDIAPSLLAVTAAIDKLNEELK
jgi:hypothetical protein